MNDHTLDASVTITGIHGRDAGKNFKILEVPPLEMATFVLRLLSAIRLDSVDELQALLSGEGKDIDAVLRVLAGCDPEAVRKLVKDILDRYVQIAPDPQHPGMFRALRDDDMKELKTLGQVLRGFVQSNVANGA